MALVMAPDEFSNPRKRLKLVRHVARAVLQRRRQLATRSHS